MRKSKGKNKKYIFWIAAVGLFGIAGLLLVPAAMYIMKLSDRYPKVFRWISFTVFAFICIYGFLFERKWDTGFVINYVLIKEARIKKGMTQQELADSVSDYYSRCVFSGSNSNSLLFI